MDRRASWINYCIDDISKDISKFKTFSEISKDNTTSVSIDSILPDDLLERILAHLPIAAIFRAGSVCKKWNEIITSKSYLRSVSHILPQKPWYFMFTSSDEPTGYTYDPILRKWYNIELPCIDTSNWFIASSCGLVCFMDNDSRSEVYVCNPITQIYKRLEDPTGLKFSDYSALAISVDKISRGYTITVVKSKEVPDNFFQCDISIHIYDSETMIWITPTAEILTGWRGGDESVICNGVLYFMLYSTGSGSPENRHGLIGYNLSTRPGPSSHNSLMKSFIPVPCALTCGRLMNLKEKLIMVGGIGKHDRTDIIKGIGIWVLQGKQWQEISRMPHKCFQGFGELDDVFASSGTDDLIYIQSYGSPLLLVFDMNQKIWKWSHKCPVSKRFPLQLFTGFCFEPRLEIAP